MSTPLKVSDLSFVIEYAACGAIAGKTPILLPGVPNKISRLLLSIQCAGSGGFLKIK